MPDLGPGGRGGARRRTRRRMMAVGAVSNRGSDDQEQQEYDEPPAREAEAGLSDETEVKLEKLAKLLKNKGVITESEYDLLFG
jgi:hypothetical protein